MRKLLLIAILTVAGALYGQTNLYITTTGSDSNNCTIGAPCLSANRTDQLATAGTTVHVAAGNYTGPWLITASGTSSAHIVYISDTKWGAIINATGQDSSGGNTFRNKGQWVDIEQFQITGDGADGILNDASNVRFIGNWVHNITDASCHGGGGLHSWRTSNPGSVSNVSWIGNLINDIGPNPGGTGTDCNQVHGIYEENSGGIIYNNVVFRASGYGIHLFHLAKSVTVANNTSFANVHAGVVVGGSASEGSTDDNTAVFNNILVNNKTYGIEVNGSTGSHNLATNNLIFGNTVGAVQSTSCPACPITSQNQTSSDPLFVNYAPTSAIPPADYHLKSTSPAIGIGTGSTTAGTLNAVAPSTDFDGNSRGPSYDAGAYQFQPQGGITRPQNCENAQASVSSSSCTMASNVTAGDGLVVFCRTTFPNTITSVTDTRGNTYTSLTTFSQGGNPGSTGGIFYKLNSPAGSDTITCNSNGTGNILIVAAEYNGITAVDKNASAIGTSTAGSSGNVTTVSNNEVLFNGCATSVTSGTVTYTAGTNFTIISNDTQFQRLGSAEDQIVTVTGTYAGTYTFSPSNNWGCALGTFSAAAVNKINPRPRLYAF